MLEATLARLERLAILSKEQADAVVLEEVEQFCLSELGHRLFHSAWKTREQPFSYTMPAGEAYRGLTIWTKRLPDLRMNAAAVILQRRY